MEKASILPQLPAQDIQGVINLIQHAYAPTGLSPEEQKRIQHELMQVQKKPEAWGLVIPLLGHEDGNVQFFGGHTAQIKIARDWDTIPAANRLDLKDVVLALTAHAIEGRRNRVVLRKLFVALTTLALKLATTTPPLWTSWIEECVGRISGACAKAGPSTGTELTMEFLAIVAEEVASADLLRESKAQITTSLRTFSPTLIQQVIATSTRPGVSEAELVASLKCTEAWVGWGLPADQLTPLLPPLITLISSENTFIPASELLQTILTESSLADGAGTKTVTEPLFEWVERCGRGIFASSMVDGTITEIGHSFCKLIVSLADHSTPYITSHLSSPSVQTLLNLLLAFTSLPGYYGVDEEESELTLAFWYRLQEEIWNTDYGYGGVGTTKVGYGAGDFDGVSDLFSVSTAGATGSGSISGSLLGSGSGSGPTSTTPRHPSSTPEPETHRQSGSGEQMWRLSQDIYRELIKRLRVKVTWPPAREKLAWMQDQRARFVVYRRDVGDTLINAYYVLRDELLQYYVEDLYQQLNSRRPEDGWESVEATLHCILSVQEAVPILDNPHLARLFSNEMLGRLPVQGDDLVRQTILNLIASYSTWFPSQPTTSLMVVITYVVSALSPSTPILHHPASNALRDLCDANRAKLTPHISDFGQLYANIGGISDSEKAKVVQSIASVVEALEPTAGVDPIQAIISPIVARAFEAMGLASQLPEEARTLCIYQLEAITACARGLTKNSETMFILDEPSPQEMEVMNSARADERMVRVREQIVEMLRRVLDVWMKDASVYDATSDLLRAITALPGDTTLLTLPPGPILQLICELAAKDVNAIWLSQAGRLILQLNPPTFSSLKPTATQETLDLLTRLMPGLIHSSLTVLGGNGGMIANPDIIKALFECMTTLSEHFLIVFFTIPVDIFQALMDCAVAALMIEERYSLVKSCLFLNSLCNNLLMNPEMEAQAAGLTDAYGFKIIQAVIHGIAGVAPRSVIPNLTDLLTNLVSKRRERSRTWLHAILFENELPRSKAGDSDKKKFLESVVLSRSTRKTREAVQQFAIVARGLEGSAFGYSTLSSI